MIIMALDHVRDLMHANPLSQSPTDMATTTPALFMTRWITHLCAPTFVFLSGLSAYLGVQSSSDFVASRRFLITRGIWLVIVNFTINNFAIYFDIHFGVLFSQVIAAIGFGFIGLGLLLKFSVKTLGIIGLVIVFGHDLFLGVSFNNPSLNGMWQELMGVAMIPLGPKTFFLVSYPIIPWLGIILTGFAFGSLFNVSPQERQKLFLKIGLGALVLFVALRTFNIYGDVNHWSPQKNGVFSLLSFINTTKYPPSLLFCLMTLGISIVLLSFFDKVQNRATEIVSVYGRVPLFYWLLHWFVIHFVAIGVYLSKGYQWSDLQFEGFGMGRPQNGGGLDLAGVYIAWICVVVFMYPVSRWYGWYKQTHKDKIWLRYL